MNKYDKAFLKIIEIFNNIQLGDIYSPKEFSENITIIREIIKKEQPKKLIKYPFSKEWHCPTCGTGNGEYEGTVGTHNYCHYCGQKLEWEDDKNDNQNL